MRGVIKRTNKINRKYNTNRRIINYEGRSARGDDLPLVPGGTLVGLRGAVPVRAGASGVPARRESGVEGSEGCPCAPGLIVA